MNKDILSSDESNQINDILPADVRKLIVLESRHKDEMYEGYPAAGATDRNLTDTLLAKRGVPFSLLLQVPQVAKFYRFPDLSHIDIMNVCPVPLQETAYTDNNLEPPKNIGKLMEVRSEIQGEKKRENARRAPTISLPTVLPWKKSGKRSTATSVSAWTSSRRSWTWWCRSGPLHGIWLNGMSKIIPIQPSRYIRNCPIPLARAAGGENYQKSKYKNCA